MGMLLALTSWIFWSWQGYAERASEWRSQRAQDTFETLNAVIASMSNGELTDWKQVETVLSSIIRGSRTLFVVVQGRHGRLIETGTPPDFLMTNSTQGEMTVDDVHVLWAPLRPASIPSNWIEALNATHLGLGHWPQGNPVMYLGMRFRAESFSSSWLWRRQGPIVASALACIMAVTAVWIAGIRRRLLAGALAAERLRSAHLEELGLAAAGLAHETKNPLGIIMGMAQQIAAQLQGTIQEIQGLVRDVRGNAPIQETLENANGFLVDMRKRVDELGTLFGKVDGLLVTSQTSLDGVAGSLRETSRTVNRAVQDGGGELVALLRELRDTNQTLQERMGRIEAQLTPVLAQARQGVAEAGGLMKDARSVLDANDQNLYLLILQLQETSRHLQGLSEDLRAHPWKVIWKGDGAPGEGDRRGPEEWRTKGRIGRHGKE